MENKDNLSNGTKIQKQSSSTPSQTPEPPLPSREVMIQQISETLLKNPRHLERYIESLPPAERDQLQAQVEQDMKNEEAKKPRFILGSASEWRQKIFKEMEPVFEIIKPDLDEKTITLPDTDDRANSDPVKLTLAIARAKAENILEQFIESPFMSDRYLITSDQVAVFNKQIREKPKDAAEAKKWLAQYASKPIETCTAVVVTNIKTKERYEGTDLASQQFKKLPAKVVTQLVEKGDILNCCGAFMVEDPIVAPYLGKRTGTATSIQGFPRNLVRKLLNQAQKIESKDEKEEEETQPEVPSSTSSKPKRASKKKVKEDEEEGDDEEEEEEEPQAVESKNTNISSAMIAIPAVTTTSASTAAQAAAAAAVAAATQNAMIGHMSGMPLGAMPHVQMPMPMMMPLAPMGSPTSPGGDKPTQRRGRGRPPKVVPKKEKKPGTPTTSLPTSPLIPATPSSPLSPPAVTSPKEKKPAAKPNKKTPKPKKDEVEETPAAVPKPESEESQPEEEKKKQPKAKKPSAKKGKKSNTEAADEVATAVDAAVAAAAGDKTENKAEETQDEKPKKKPVATPTSTRPKRDRKKRKLSDDEEEE